MNVKQPVGFGSPTPQQALEASTALLAKEIDKQLNQGYRTIRLDEQVGFEVIDWLMEHYRAIGWDLAYADRRQEIVQPHHRLSFKS